MKIHQPEHRIALNVVSSHHGRLSRVRRLFQFGAPERESTEDPIDSAPDRVNLEDRIVVRDAIDKALAALPDELRVAVVLRGLSRDRAASCGRGRQTPCRPRSRPGLPRGSMTRAASSGIADWRAWTFRLAPVAAAAAFVAVLSSGQESPSAVSLEEWAVDNAGTASRASLLWNSETTADSVLETMLTGDDETTGGTNDAR